MKVKKNWYAKSDRINGRNDGELIRAPAEEGIDCFLNSTFSKGWSGPGAGCRTARVS
jgi:hypothetical protein